jgi:hypothetical protein
LADADAAQAAGLVDAGAGRDQIRQPPVAGQFASVWREDGLMSKETWSWACLPLTISAAIAKSRSPGLADEPITIWKTGSPAASRTGTTLPGLEGAAISGSSRDRSMLSVTS